MASCGHVLCLLFTEPRAVADRWDFSGHLF